jgi:hypothetical protein
VNCFKQIYNFYTSCSVAVRTGHSQYIEKYLAYYELRFERHLIYVSLLSISTEYKLLLV